jgi:hypothetical protein
MVDAEETKRQKAKQLRFRKPIAKNLNLDFMKQDLYDIQEQCEYVHYFTDSDDGNDSLINALDGDEDEAYEFKMAFADLCAECERMREDLEEEWIPECFDIFFVATASDNEEMFGWDSYEGDYYGIGYSDNILRENAGQKLKKMTKDDLIEASLQCMKIYQAYIGLRNRYDSLKNAIDVLRDQNTGHLQVVREIERMYEEVSKDYHSRDDWSKESREWKQYTDALPAEAWIA